MSSLFSSLHVHSAAELMQAALHAHDRELQDMKSGKQMEIESLHLEIAALRRDKAALEQRIHQQAVSTAAIEDHHPSSDGDTSKSTPVTRAQAEPCATLDAEENTDAVGTAGDGNAPGSESSDAGANSMPPANRNVSDEFHNLVCQKDAIAHHSRLRRFVHGPLDDFVYVAIFLNSIFIFVQLQFLGHETAAAAGLLDVRPPNETVQTVLSVFEHVFNAFFLFEVCVRIIAFRRHFFSNEFTRQVEVLNIIDLVIVVLTSVDLYLLPKGHGGDSMNYTVFRSLRFLRIAKIARIGMAIKLFGKLKVLLATVACSMLALFWSIVLIFGCLLVIALVANQLVALSLQDESISLERREWMFIKYGTSTRAYWTLFELTFSGGWPQYAGPLVEEVSSLWAIFFFLHIVVVQFAMFRIVTALFLRDTLALAAKDAEAAIQEKLRVQEEVGDKLLAFFHEADSSKDGMLSREEFATMLENPVVPAWLSLLDLDVRDAMQAFTLMEHAGDSCDGNIDADQFVKGMMRIKGFARAQDVLAIWHLTTRLAKDVSLLSSSFHEMKHSMLEDPLHSL